MFLKNINGLFQNVTEFLMSIFHLLSEESVEQKKRLEFIISLIKFY